jgi:hypothetical protein
MTSNTDQIVEKVKKNVSILTQKTNSAQWLEELEHGLSLAGVWCVLDGSVDNILDSWQPLPTGWDEDTLLDLGLKENVDYIERKTLRARHQESKEQTSTSSSGSSSSSSTLNRPHSTPPSSRTPSTPSTINQPGDAPRPSTPSPGTQERANPEPQTNLNAQEQPKRFFVKYRHVMDRSKLIQELSKERSCRLAIEALLEETWKSKVQESLGEQRTALQVYAFIKQSLCEPDAIVLAEKEKSLYSVVLSEDGDPDQYLKSCLLQIKEGKLLGLQPAKEHPERILISGLPPSYSTEIRNIESQGKGISIEQVIKIVEARSKKRKADQAFNTDIVSDSATPPPPKLPRSGDQSSADGNSNDNRCSFCSRNGHMDSGCFVYPLSSKFRLERARRIVNSNTNSPLAKKIIALCPRLLLRNTQGSGQASAAGAPNSRVNNPGQQRDEGGLYQTFLTALELQQIEEIRNQRK